MAENIDESLRATFLKLYADIPLNLRGETILVLDDGPITWNSAYVEIKNRTENAQKILKALLKLRII